MAHEVFNKDTLLDLMVNGIPLFIHIFFIGVILALPYFGFDGLAAIQSFGILTASAVFLAVLSYVAARAISRSENNAEVYVPGQATVEGSKPLTEREEDRVWEEESEGDQSE